MPKNPHEDEWVQIIFEEIYIMKQYKVTETYANNRYVLNNGRVVFHDGYVWRDLHEYGGFIRKYEPIVRNEQITDFECVRVYFCKPHHILKRLTLVVGGLSTSLSMFLSILEAGQTNTDNNALLTYILLAAASLLTIAGVEYTRRKI